MNGLADKCDANFIGAFFFQEIKNLSICIGNYPSEFSEIARLSQAGVTGVLNLQTADDIASRSINQDKIIKIYQQCKILNVINIPIDDGTEKSFEEQLVEAAVQLHKMVKLQRLKVFVHCTSGYNRAPAVVITYLCLFMLHPNWQSSYDVAAWLKMNYKASYPNLKLVKRTIESNDEITNREKDRIQNDQDRQRKLEEQEQERQRQLDLERQRKQEEIDRLRKKEQDERDRLMKIKEE